MQAHSLQSTRCCHEIHKLLKQKTSEELIGPIDFKFDSSAVYMTRKTISGKFVTLEIATAYSATYKIVFNLLIIHSEPILDVFKKCEKSGSELNLSLKKFNNLIYNELTDFFALNYQKFI